MPYTNEWQRQLDQRIAALEKRIFGRALGPDGSVRSKAEHEEQRRVERNAARGGPTPYTPPKAGVNRAARPPKPQTTDEE